MPHALLTLILLLLPLAAQAEEDLEILEPAWVYVDRTTWLYEQPREDAPRFRPVTVDTAAAYTPSPVVVLQRRARMGDWVKVRIATHAPDLDPDGFPRAPDATPRGWPHCYPQPAAIAQLRLDVWVHASDLLQVVTRPFEITPEGGGTLALDRGLVVRGGGGGYQIRSHRLTLLAPLPDDAVGDHVPIDGGPPVSRTFLARTDEGTSFAVHPSWTSLVDLRRGRVDLRTPKDAEGDTVVRLDDRCLRATLAAPTKGVPRVDLERLRAASTVPIQVPEKTAITRLDGTRLGEVASGSAVIWARPDCRFDDDRGMCCDPLAGTEVAGEGDTTMCFAAELPVRVMQRDLGVVLAERQTEMARETALVATSHPTVSWTVDGVKGAIGPRDVTDALDREGPALLDCYRQVVDRDPDVEGDLPLRFAFAPDGRGRSPRLRDGGVTHKALLECVDLRVRALVAPMQIGEDTTIVDLTLHFDRGDDDTP